MSTATCNFCGLDRPGGVAGSTPAIYICPACIRLASQLIRDHARPPEGQPETLRKQYHFWRGEHGLDAWDVDRLVDRAKDLPIENVPIEEIWEVDSVYWFDAATRPTVRAVIEHFRLTQEVDMVYPIVLGPDGRIMDGMHRVARALLEGRDTIAAVRLPVLPDPDYRNCRPQDLPY